MTLDRDDDTVCGSQGVHCKKTKTGRAIEDDVIKFKILIEAESYRAPLPEYRRISVNVARIGKLKSKTAIDHLFNAKGNIYGTLRQVTFSHRGRGFIFTCATSVDRFDTANRQFFEALFDSMEFR